MSSWAELCQGAQRRSHSPRQPFLGEEKEAALQPQQQHGWDMLEECQVMVPAMESRGHPGGANQHDCLQSKAALHSRITYSKILQQLHWQGGYQAGGSGTKPGCVAQHQPQMLLR